MEYSLNNRCLDVTFKTKGGTLKSIRDRNGLEYLWQGDPEYWSGQAPVLFPICGSIRNDTAIIGNGRTTHMPRHGIIRKKEFTMEKQSPDEIIFSITSNEEMLNQFPYEFKVSSIFGLKENTISVTYRVENTGNEKMPFFVGGHPAFCCPLEDGESFEDYHLIFPEKETCAPSTPLPDGLQDLHRRIPLLSDTNDLQLSYSYFAHDVRALDTLKSRSVKLVSARSGRGIQMDFEDFPYLMLWNNKRGRFLAIEPWTGLSTTTDEDNIFEHKKNVQYANPGEAKDYTYKITILF
ncbi:MAG: aldose 1-epimerase family protein [Bilifractor sp.]|jgi:galactose mutarotase-like enzyme